MYKNNLNIGISVVDISPQKGVELCGYASRSEGNIGIHDKLFAKVLFVDNGISRGAIISCDLIGIDFEIIKFVKDKIKEKIDIDPNSIMISCSHTHSGPVTIHNNGIGLKDENYINFLKAQLIKSIEDAASELIPAEAFYCKDECNIGINRRGKIQEGSIEPFPDPEGFVDNQVSSIVFYQNGNKKPAAILFNYGCHPTVGGYDNLYVSADFPGTACSFIENSFENNIIAFFTNGGAGNINPIVRGSFNAVNLNGDKLANSVLNSIRKPVKKLRDQISFNAEEVILPFEEVPDKTEFEKLIIKYNDLLDRSIKGSVEEKIYKANFAWAKKYLKETVANNLKEFLKINLQILNIGGIYFVGIPGEVFAETSAWIKKQFMDEVIVLSYTNGNVGYLPIKDEITKGGYEVSEAFKYYDFPGRFSSRADENIKNVSIKLITLLKDS